jgi:hypothetical protein
MARHAGPFSQLVGFLNRQRFHELVNLHAPNAA